MAFTAAQVDVKFNSLGADKLKSDIKSVGSAVDGVQGKSGGFLKGAIQTAAGMFGGELITRGVDQLKNLGGAFIGANADAETMRLQLEIATGSVGEANKVFDNLMVIAKQSPFEFPELANSARMIEQFGMDSEKWIPVLGDTAAATGKSIDQVTNALLDAQTGEFERLKELGIRSVEENGQQYLQYVDKNGKLVKKAIDRNNPAIIESTLQGIWNEQYGGAMDKLSSTFQGKMSTFKDNVNLMMQDLSKPVFEAAKSGLTFANTWFEQFGALRELGLSPLEAAFTSLKQTIAFTFGPEIGDKINGVLDSIAAGIAAVVPIITGAFGIARDVIGSVVGFIVDHIGTIGPLVAGAAAGFAVFSAVTSTFAAVAGVVGPILAAIAAQGGILAAIFAALTSPIFLVVAAFAAFALAYKTNFMGFGDFVDGAISKAISAFNKVVATVDKVVGAFQKFRSMGANPVIAALAALRAVFPGLSGVLTPIMRTITQLTEAFNRARSAGMDPLAAAVDALTSMFPGLSGVLNAVETQIRILFSAFMNLVDAARNVGQAFMALLSGDLSGFFSNLGEAAVSLGKYLLDLGKAALNGVKILLEVFKAIPWGEIWQGLQDAWDAIPWQEMGRKAIDFIKSALSSAADSGIFQWISDALMDALQGMSDMMLSGLQMAWNAISSLNWSDFVPLLDWAMWIGGKIADIAEWIWGKISTYFPQAAVIAGGAIADFAGWVWGKISTYFPTAAVIAGGAIADLAGWLWEKISAFFPQAVVVGGNTISDVATWLWGKVKGYFPTTSVIAGAIADVAEWAWGKIKTHFPVAAVIAGSIADVAEWAWGKIKEHFPIATVITGTISDVGEWVWGKIKDKFPPLIVISGVIEIGTWLWGKISDKFPSEAVITGAISDFGSWLYEKIGSPTLSLPSKGDILNAITLGIFGGSTEGGPGDFGAGGENDVTRDTQTDLTTDRDGNQAMPVTNPFGNPFQRPGPSQGDMGIGSLSDLKVPDLDLSSIRVEIELTRQAFLTFVADTVGVMGGWLGGISTMMSTFSSVFHPPISQGTSNGKQSFITFVADTIGVMGGWLGGVQTIVNSTMSTFQSRISSGTSTGKQSFLTFVADTIGVMGGWSGGMVNIVNGAMSGFQSRMSSGTSAGKQSVITFVADTIGVMGGWSGGIQNIVSGAMSGVASSVRGGMSQASGAIRSESGSWIGIINGAAGGMGAAGYNAGAAAGFGVANGLGAALGAVQSAANQIIATADAALRKAAEIRSPSKRMARIGALLTDGLSRGLLDSSSVRSLQDSSSRLVDAVDSALGTSVAGPVLRSSVAAAVPAANVDTLRATSTQPAAVNQNTFLVISSELLQDFLETVDGFAVLTDSTELKSVLKGS